MMKKGKTMTEKSDTIKTLNHDQDTLDAHQLWLDAVHTAAGKAYERLPDLGATISQAYSLVIEGKVSPLARGGFQVASGLSKGRQFFVVNPHCECPEAASAVKGLCCHKVAVLLTVRAQELLGSPTQPAPDTPAEPRTPAEAQAPTPDLAPLTIPSKYIVDIQGTLAVRFAGLLLLAHERGLVSLTADWTLNDPELSLAHAVAVFSDGRKFEEAGDASPTNVGKKVAGHFRRVALTRAKARALRDALGVDLVAVEEMAD
jgi:hypothetical protein